MFNPHFNTGVLSPNSTLSTASISATFSNPNYQDVVVISNANTSEPALEVKGKIKMKNGDFLDDRLERIEALLNIPSRDVLMEEKYPRLKRLWEEYYQELEKCKTWDKLKED